MVQYDFTIDQINVLEGAQANLNDNITNDKLQNILVQTAKEVAKNLKERYPDDWESPIKA